MTTFVPRAPTRLPGIAIIVAMTTLASIDGLNLSTGGLDNTAFSMCKDGPDYVFTFSVADATPCFLPQTSSKRDLEREDRVELYFSPTADLSKPYYCAEIDPLGRVLDYRAAYYRDFDYSWGFTTLRTLHARTENLTGLHRPVSDSSICSAIKRIPLSPGCASTPEMPVKPSARVEPRSSKGPAST